MLNWRFFAGDSNIGEYKKETFQKLRRLDALQILQEKNKWFEFIIDVFHILWIYIFCLSIALKWIQQKPITSVKKVVIFRNRESVFNFLVNENWNVLLRLEKKLLVRRRVSEYMDSF